MLQQLKLCRTNYTTHIQEQNIHVKHFKNINYTSQELTNTLINKLYF